MTDAGRSRIEVGDEVDVEVRAIADGGAGVASLPDGRVVFVHRTAPGDRARIRVTSLRPRWARGRLVRVEDPGPGRRDAPCPYYDRCGGCTLEHLVYREQLRWKERLIADALDRIGGRKIEGHIPMTPSVHEFRYRNRVTFHLRRLRDDRVVAGFHRLERPGRIVDVGSDCLLPEEELAATWAGLRSAWGPGARLLPAGDALRLTLRSVDGGAILLVEPEAEARGGRASEEDAAELIDRVDGLVAIWWRGSRVEEEPVLLAGTSDTTEQWWGRTLSLGPTAFLQVNRETAEELRSAVLEALEADDPDGDLDGRTVVDAFCGVGVYGHALSRRGARVVGIELDPEAVRIAREGAPADFEVVVGRVEDVLHHHLPVDTVLVNPPRGGLDARATEALATHPPRRLVYVSCNPATLARDLSRLGERYRIDSIRAFDLFPQTSHVETVLRLDRVGD